MFVIARWTSGAIAWRFILPVPALSRTFWLSFWKREYGRVPELHGGIMMTFPRGCPDPRYRPESREA